MFYLHAVRDAIPVSSSLFAFGRGVCSISYNYVVILCNVSFLSCSFQDLLFLVSNSLARKFQAVVFFVCILFAVCCDS